MTNAFEKLLGKASEEPKQESKQQFRPLTGTRKLTDVQTGGGNAFDKLLGDKTSVSSPLGNLPANQELRQAPDKTFFQKAKDVVLSPFVRGDKEQVARDSVVASIHRNLNPANNPEGPSMTDIDRDLPDYTKALGLRSTPTIEEVSSALIAIPITAGIIANPIPAIAGLAAFQALSEAESLIVNKIKGEEYKFLENKNVADLLPAETNDATRLVVEIVDLVVKGKALHYTYKKTPGVIEKFTKDVVVKNNLPKNVYLEPKKVKSVFQTGDKISAEEMDLLKSLGLTGPQYRDAIKNGITIEVPTEKMITIADKPYWAKIKSILGIKPASNVNIIRADVKVGPRGLIESGAVKPNAFEMLIPKAPINTTEAKPNAFTKLLKGVEPEVAPGISIIPDTKLIEQYKALPKSEEVFNNILTELELSEKGSRFFTETDRQGGTKEVNASKSTFPKWIPEELRSKALFDDVINIFDTPNVVDSIVAPDAKSKQGRLLEAIYNEADARLGADTKQLRQDLTIEKTTPIKSIQERRKQAIKERSTKPSDEITEDDVLKFFEVPEPKRVAVPTMTGRKESISIATKGLKFIEQNHPDKTIRNQANSALLELDKNPTQSIADSMRESFREELKIAKASVDNKIKPKEVKASEPKTVSVFIKSKFSDKGASTDLPIIRKESNITLFQGGTGEGRQFWTPNRKYAEQFGNVTEKTGDFYKVDNGNRVTDVYVEVPAASQNDTAKTEKKTNVKKNELDALTNSSKGSPKSFPSLGKFADVEMQMAGMSDIKAIEFPELVSLVRDLIGNVPTIKAERGRKMFGGQAPYGMFTGNVLDPRISLNPEIFKDPAQAAKTLAHEMGHLTDFLPDMTMARGNLLGRLKSLRKFMSSTLSENGTKMDIAEIKKQITKDFKEESGLTWAEFNKKLKSDNKLKTDVQNAIYDIIEKEHGIRNAVIKEELQKITQLWKPFTPIPGDSFTKYRFSPEELYADAISVLFNNPALLKENAPTFYEAFFNGLDTKPQVREAYFDLQEFLRGGEKGVIAARRAGVRGMFRDGDLKSIDLEANKQIERKASLKNAGFWLKTEFVDKNTIVNDRVKALEKQGKYINEDDDPRYILEERNYLSGYIKGTLQESIQPIRNWLGDNDLTWDDFGEYLFYKRIIDGDRSTQANPRGITPDAAKKSLDSLLEDVGAEKKAGIESHATDFRKFLVDINEKAYKAGLYSEELFNQMKENPSYVTFQLIDFLELGMTSAVHKSIGTLRDITNPATASIIKAIKVIQATERNTVTKSVVNLYNEHYPDEIKPANVRTISTKNGVIKEPIESKIAGEELVTFMEGGKRKGFYVDPYTAKSINNDSIGRNITAVKALGFINSALFRPLFITYSVGFQSFNLFRDFFRFWKNTPKITMWESFKLYKKSLPVAKARGFGVTDKTDLETIKILEKLEKDRILSITYNDFVLGARTDENQLDLILDKYDIDYFTNTKDAVANSKKRLPQIARSMLDFIKRVGDTVETLPKVAGYYNLSDGGKRQLKPSEESFIRKSIGSPDFLAGGLVKPVTNEVFLFSNSIIQGWRSDLNIATGPKTRGGYWWKTAKMNVIPKIMMVLASAGYFGKELRDMMNDASEYDKTNYIIIPLGRDSSGKTIYFRMPQDETGRFMGAITWKALNMFREDQTVMKGLMDIVSYTGGQIPTPTPTFDAASSLYQFMSGQNPYDTFRGRNVLSDDVFSAGGLPAAKAYFGWLFQQVGGGMFYRFYHEPTRPTENGKVETIVNFPFAGNVLGRFVRVSNYGQTERLNLIKEAEEKVEAKNRLTRKESIYKNVDDAIKDPENKEEYKQRMLNEVYGEGTPETKEEYTKYKADISKFEMYFLRGTTNDPNVDALLNATSANQKKSLLSRIKSDIGEDRWVEFKDFLLTNDLVTSKIIIDMEYEE